MVARPGFAKLSFNSGELSPDVLGRTDVESFYSGAALMDRAYPVPQGGFAQLPGSRFHRILRPVLSASSMTIVPTGGAISQNGVIATCTLSFPADISCVDLTAAIATGSAVVRAEIFVGAGWIPLQAISIGTNLLSRRFARPPDEPATSSQVRLVRVDAGAAATFTVSAATARIATGTFPLIGKIFPFSYSSEDQLDLALYPGAIDIFRDGVWVAALAHPYSAGQIPSINVEQRKDVMLLFHKDVATQRLIRLSDEDWVLSEQVFENIPKTDFGDVTYAKVSEKWTMFLDYVTGDSPNGMAVVVSVNGEDTTAVVLSTAVSLAAGWTQFAVDLKAALEALTGVQPGLVVTAVAPGAASLLELSITFDGAGNTGSTFSLTGKVVSSNSASINFSRTIKADAGGEPLTSATRGYAADGEYHQQRLLTGGFRSRGSAVLASVLSD
jgi:hypothetical protein